MKKKAVILSVIALLIILVVNFPVYRLIVLSGFLPDYYSKEEIQMAMYIGTPWDRAAVKDVMNLANEAFSDCGHSEAENDKRYGELSWFASSSDIYPETVKTEYSLRLWSAHLDETEGYLWVYYSQEGIDAKGEIDYGSFGIASLWTVEKDADGKWVVTDIKEHP